MQCACQHEGPVDKATHITLCDLHSREFHRRIEDARGPDDNAIWDKAIDAAERMLVGPNGSPTDVWIVQRLGLLRK